MDMPYSFSYMSVIFNNLNIFASIENIINLLKFEVAQKSNHI